MDRITQEAYQRQRILKWAEKKSVTAAAIRYKVSRKTVYKWKKRHDGMLESLKDRSRAPHRIARKQTEEEQAQAMRYAKRYAGDLLLGYEKARANGYNGATTASSGQLPSCYGRGKSAGSERTSRISGRNTPGRRFR